jgi:hypothetical protein
VEPTGYDAASVDAVTAMTESAHSGTAVLEGLADGLFVGDVEGLADVALEVGVALVERVGLVVGVGEPLEAAGVPEPEDPNARWSTQRPPSSRATTTSRASSRRTQ